MAKEQKEKKDWSKSIIAAVLIPLLAIAAGFVLHYLPDKELPAIIFESNPPLKQAREKVDEGNDSDALPFIEEAIALDPTNPQSYLLEAEIMLRQGRQSEAVQALDAAAKAVPKPLQKTMRDTRTQVKKSPVDGYIGISSTYEKFGLREIAIALLKRVCRELPEEGRLREALEKLVGTIDEEDILDNYEPIHTEEPEQEDWIQNVLNIVHKDSPEVFFALYSIENDEIPDLFVRSIVPGGNGLLSILNNITYDRASASIGNHDTIELYRKKSGPGFVVSESGIHSHTFIEGTRRNGNDYSRVNYAYGGTQFNTDHYNVMTEAEYRDYLSRLDREFVKIELIRYTPGMNIEDAWIR